MPEPFQNKPPFQNKDNPRQVGQALNRGLLGNHLVDGYAICDNIMLLPSIVDLIGGAPRVRSWIDGSAMD
jgi:hypothetical protein